MRLLALIFISFAVTVMPVQAQVDSSSFSIKLFGFDDDIAPTTPNLLSVTPVSSSQLDVDWSVSTDNRTLSGYVLTRDGVPIATTTLTSFSDTGLTASTTYLYSVQAFDAAGNYSSSSNSLSGTTPDIPPPVATSTDNTGGATSARVALENFSVETDTTNAFFSLETARPARITISWGRTIDYELGYLQNASFVRSHVTTITDLEPGTVYEYEVIGYTPSGHPTVLKQGQFTTDGGVVPVLGNVQRLQATVTGSDVRLDWELPDTTELANVRIVRSHLGFPQNSLDGAIVYQGRGTSFFDAAVLDQFSPVYYTVFTIDQYGNTSSGAVVSAAMKTSGEGVIYDPIAPPEHPPLDTISTGTIEIIDERATTSPEVATTTPNEQLRIPSLEEIFISQNGKQYSFADTEIVLRSDQQYVISIPQTAVMRNLKTILVSFTDPENAQQSYSYILRLNNDQTAYEAAINPLLVAGWSNFTVAIYDYESRIVSRYFKQVQFSSPKEQTETVVFPDYFFAHPELLLAGVSILILLLLLLLRRKRE